jgi:tRNA threonylcarbamoyladenosine biosynthesis protein TsaE
MVEPRCVRLESAEATIAAGESLALALLAAAPECCTLYLSGELGAGKTTLARGFLRGLGHTGRVPSPTYTLVEPYELEPYLVYHLDLYRLSGAAEIEFLGVDGMLAPGVVMMVEWPERAGGRLPAADLQLRLQVSGTGRDLRLEAKTGPGEAVIRALGAR